MPAMVAKGGGRRDRLSYSIMVAYRLYNQICFDSLCTRAPVKLTEGEKEWKHRQMCTLPKHRRQKRN